MCSSVAAVVSCLELQMRTNCSDRAAAIRKAHRRECFFLFLSCVVVVVISPDLPAWRGIKARCWWLCSTGCRTFLLLTVVTGMLNEAVVVVGQDEVSVVVVPFFLSPQSKLEGPTQTASLYASVVFIGAVMAVQDV